MAITISGTTVKIEIETNSIRRTPRGCEGRATIRMADGRRVTIEGVWDDPYMCQDANLRERVWVDGIEQPEGDENGTQIADGPGDDADGTTSADIADEIARD